MTGASRRRLTERQCAKVIQEYNFEQRATKMLELLADAGVAWRRDPNTRFYGAPYFSPSTLREWVVATKAGFLGVSVYDDWLACVFDDDEAGARLVGATRPSGKWNHHAFAHACHRHYDREAIVNRLKGTLELFAVRIRTLTDVDIAGLLECAA